MKPIFLDFKRNGEDIKVNIMNIDWIKPSSGTGTAIKFSGDSTAGYLDDSFKSVIQKIEMALASL